MVIPINVVTVACVEGGIALADLLLSKATFFFRFERTRKGSFGSRKLKLVSIESIIENEIGSWEG